MPGWWHELIFDWLCIVNSLAAGVALVGVVDLRHKLKTMLGRS